MAYVKAGNGAKAGENVAINGVAEEI